MRASSTSRPALLALTLVLSAQLGCKRPPAAPAELDKLCAYLFTHFDDEDPASLEVGIDNLEAWLDQSLEETLEGYEVSVLDQDTVDALDDVDRDLTGVVGAAVGYESHNSVIDQTHALVLADQAEVFEGTYSSYTREFLSDADCFMAGDCETAKMLNSGVADYPFSLEVSSSSWADFRWVERGGSHFSTGENSLAHRTYMTGPAEVNVDWIQVREQYYLDIVMPRDGGALKLQATWFVAEVGDAPLPENMALQLVIGSMQDAGSKLDEWVDENL